MWTAGRNNIMVVQRPDIPQWPEYPNFGSKIIMPFFHSKQMKTYSFYLEMLKTIWVKVFCIQLEFSLNKLEKSVNQHKTFDLLQIYFDICPNRCKVKQTN